MTVRNKKADLKKKHGYGAPRARRGETLAEVLVAMLIVTLATLLLASMVTVSGSVNLSARQKDEKFYEALSKVEEMNSDAVVKNSSGDAETYKVIISEDGTSTEETVDVNVYTSEGLTIYKED